jgi:hypothetical protein
MMRNRQTHRNMWWAAPRERPVISIRADILSLSIKAKEGKSTFCSAGKLAVA